VRTKLTKRTVEALEPGQNAYDTEVHGFGVRCGTQHRTYHLKCFINGRQRWITIGKHGSPWTAELARKRALELLLQISSGVDPAAEKLKRRGRPTLAEFADRYIEEHAKLHKRPASLRLDRTNLSHHVLPLLGGYYLDDIKRSHITQFQSDVLKGKSARISKIPIRHGMRPRGGAVVANRCLTLLGTMFALAEKWSVVAPHSNPVRGIAKFPEQRRERFLSRDEFARLGTALELAERSSEINPYAVAAFRLLLFTGARLGEIQSLRWEWVDLERGLLLLPVSKTGQKAIRIPDPAIQILKSLPRVEGNPHVLPGARRTYLKNLHAPWSKIRSSAGLPDLRIHDLRHAFASVAAAQGKSLQTIGALLGHARTETTERYAHLLPDDLTVAGGQVALEIRSMLRAHGDKKAEM
jgi:integrase